MNKEKQRRNAEIYRPMCEELFNNFEKQYQELAKVKAEGADVKCSFFQNTANVVPKSEVETLKEKLDATIAGQETLQKALVNAKGEVAREIFEEIERYECSDLFGKTTLYMLTAEEFAELKKKYTEGKE